MECYQDDFIWSFKLPKSLRVIVVGAGIAGLATALGKYDHFLTKWRS